MSRMKALLAVPEGFSTFHADIRTAIHRYREITNTKALP